MMEVKGEKVFMRTGHYREKDIRWGEKEKLQKTKLFEINDEFID